MCALRIFPFILRVAPLPRSGRFRGLCYTSSLCSNQELTLESRLSPFWKLHGNLRNVSLTISPIPENKLILTCAGQSEEVDLKEDEAGEKVTLQFRAAKQATPISIKLPYQVGVNLELSGQGAVKISDIENAETNIMAEHYNIELENLKSHDITSESATGDIVCRKTLRGNVNLKCRNGNVTTQKIQGNKVALTAEHGSVTTGDVYVQESSICSSDQVKMTSIHGDCDIESVGDVTIGTAEGSVNVMSENGGIRMYLTDRVTHADIVSNTGDIALSFSPDLGAQIDVEAIKIDDSLAQSALNEVQQRQQGPCTRYRAELNDGGPRISLKSFGGTTTLRTSSWLEAISSFKKS